MALLCELNLLRLSDLYNVAQVCKGWNVVVSLYIQELRGLTPSKVQLAPKQNWERKLVRRHTTKKMPTSNLNSPIDRNKNSPRQVDGSINAKDAISQTLGKNKKEKKYGTMKSKSDYLKELEELRAMLENQKKIEEDLLRFKNEYAQGAHKRLRQSEEQWKRDLENSNEN